MLLYHLLWLAAIVKISQAQLPRGSYRAPNYHSGYNGYQASARLSSWNRGLDYDSGYTGYQASSMLSPSAGNIRWFEMERA